MCLELTISRTVKLFNKKFRRLKSQHCIRLFKLVYPRSMVPRTELCVYEDYDDANWPLLAEQIKVATAMFVILDNNYNRCSLLPDHIKLAQTVDTDQMQNNPPIPIIPSPFPSPLPALVPMPGEKALVQKSVCHHRAYAASYDTLTDRIPDTTSLTTSLSHTTQYTPLQIHLHLFPLFSLLRSCAQPGERAYAAVSHNCSILFTYSQIHNPHTNRLFCAL